ncbi:MAG: oxidoreductase [Flavobacteriales bacterium]|nr:oxidoreductase [Flavobacteriales bacterium]
MQGDEQGSFAVIGDSGGIGEAIRNQLLEAGHRVIGVSRKGVSEQQSDYQSLVFDAVAHPCDLSNFAGQLDGLVYCPGTIRLKPLKGVKREHAFEDFEVNAWGAVQTLQANAALLKKAPTASVVLFSTVAVQTGMPYHTSIAMAKGAVEGLTRTLAAEWSPSIRVNAIAPSLTDTPLAAPMLSSDAKREAAAERHPLKTVGKTSDLASLATWLLAGGSNFVTGQVYTADGGIGSIRK